MGDRESLKQVTDELTLTKTHSEHARTEHESQVQRLEEAIHQHTIDNTALRDELKSLKETHEREFGEAIEREKANARDRLSEVEKEYKQVRCCGVCACVSSFIHACIDSCVCCGVCPC